MSEGVKIKSPQSPLDMRHSFLRVLQREQDEALILLESSPFLSSLFVKYVSLSETTSESTEERWTNSEALRETVESQSELHGNSRGAQNPVHPDVVALTQECVRLREELEQVRTEQNVAKVQSFSFPVSTTTKDISLLSG